MTELLKADNCIRVMCFGPASYHQLSAKRC